MFLKKNHKKTFTVDDHSILSKMSDITKICDNINDIMITICTIKTGRFIYCNKASKKIIDNYEKLLENGWDFLFSLIDSGEVTAIKNKILLFLSTSFNSESCLLRYTINVHGKKICINHEIYLHKIGTQLLAVNYFFDVTKKEEIKRSFEGIKGAKKPMTISPREKEVLLLIADGFSSKQIADKLFISNHTAISHRKNLIDKFKVKNTAQLIKRASRVIQFW